MCPPPCGPRRSYRSYCASIPSEKITKAEVDDLIDYATYICSFRTPLTPVKTFEGTKQDLHKILHDGRTRVKIVGSRSSDFMYGKRTVVMTAPSVPATFILRKNAD